MNSTLTLSAAALIEADHIRLVELRQALYDWLRDGGFDPDWSSAPRARQYYGPFCDRCGGRKPADQSCSCFDNGGQ